MTEAHDNRAILRDLEARCDFLARRCEIVGGIAAVGGVYLNPIFFGIAFPLKSWLDQLQLLGLQVSLMNRLIDAFGDEIEIFPNLQPPELRRIDFFLRFPNKEFVTLMLQSRGDAVVTYNQRTEKLQYRNRKSGGLKNFDPDPLSDINLQTLWIAKERRDLKGGSSRDARRPVGKIIVLWRKTRISEHSKDLYTEVSGLRTLRIQKYGSFVWIVEESQVIEAIRAHLNRHTENKDQALNAEKALS